VNQKFAAPSAPPDHSNHTFRVPHGRVPGRSFQLALHVTGDTLRIEVTDTTADRLPQPQHATPDSETGWGVTPGAPPRKTVWAELVLTPRRTRALSSADRESDALLTEA
jgi:hypothetical protein